MKENTWTDTIDDFGQVHQLLSDERAAWVDFIGVSVLIGVIGTVVLSRATLLEKK